MDVPDLAELREKAEKATPGPWRVAPGTLTRVDGRRAFVASTFFSVGALDQLYANAAYVAAVSPDVVLAILSLVDRLQEYIRVVEALQEADADTMGTLVREYNAARADLGLAGSPAANEGKEGGA